MPPKKKGKTISPIVVGTVSTRSTRRQSIVNIEIPRLSRSKTRKVQGLDKQSDNFCEKIKASYNKVVGVGDRKEALSVPFIMSDNSVKSREVSSSFVNSDNKELLQILEDWSDEDSQENKKDVSKIDEVVTGNEINKSCMMKKLERVSDNESNDFFHILKGDNKNFENMTSNISEIENHAPRGEIMQTNMDNEYNKNYSITLIDNVSAELLDEQNMHLKKAESTLSDSESEIIQSQVEVSVETEQFEVHSPNDISCEEILRAVPHSVSFQPEIDLNLSKEIIVQEENLEVTPNNTPSEELKISDQGTVEVKSNILCDDNSMSSSEYNSLNQTSMRDSLNNDETLQSFSTTDSNDSEVRKYFSKEMDKNETIIQKTLIITDNDSNDIGDKTLDEENCINTNHPKIKCDEKMLEVTEENNVTTENPCARFGANSIENQNVENMFKMLDNKDISYQQTSDISQCKKISNFDKLKLKNVNEEFEVTGYTIDINDCNIMSNNEVMKGNLSEALENILPQTVNDTATLTQKVAALNIAVPKKKKQMPTKGISKKDLKNVNNKIISHNIKTCTKEVSINMQLTEHFDQMNLTPSTEPQFKRKQRLNRSSSVQQLPKQKLQKHNKIEEKREIVKNSLIEILNKLPESSTDKTAQKTFPKEKKNNINKKSKKQPSILGSKIKIKFSSNKKVKNTFNSTERKMRTENVKKKDQQEVKIFKDSCNKNSNQFDKKGRDIFKKKDPEGIKHQKELLKKQDQPENRKIQIKKQDSSDNSILQVIYNKIETDNKSEAEGEDIEIRRSSRIKSINVMKRKTIGHGLVRSKSEISLNESDVSDNSSLIMEPEKAAPVGTPATSPKSNIRERKTRWSKSVENVIGEIHPNSEWIPNQEIMKMEIDEKHKFSTKDDPVVQARLKQFVLLKENIYKTSRMTCKEAKKMTCDCFLTEEEIHANEFGCGEDCLNRLLLIECGNLCQVGDRCTNKRFQTGQFAPVEVFNTEKKGLGLRAAANIPYGEFILEYVGEVLNSDEFDKRAEVYSQDKNIHYYFMALRADAIIDATMKGNISRFINHSCDPNAETQKWTVNGELRIGFFSTRTILAGEEITFDYRFQRYGKEAQKCYCGAAICRGWLGEEPDEESDEDYEEEEIVETPELTQTAELHSNDSEKVDISFKELQLEEKSVTPGVIQIQKELLTTEKIKSDVKSVLVTTETIISPATSEKKIIRKKVSKRKPRVELFEEIDQLNEEIEMLLATGLKNQAHTLKLSRLMVRAQAPQQRTKLLRVLRRGELPCRRLFLDYHGLRLMHGYMIDAQHLVVADKKYESLRLEMLQTLAVLPIPNKTMLQDSKVLSTVEKWASNKNVTSPLDSDSNSPKIDADILEVTKKLLKKEENKTDENIPERSIEDQEEEIRFLASKLLEEWKNLKEVFRIPKKERIEQMKEHEREANKKFMQSGYGQDQERDKKLNEMRYRGASSKFKYERDNKKSSKNNEQYSAEFMKLSKIERRKLFAIQHELKEEERRLKQRELWRQHEMNCLMIGTDPRFTAPFDPSKPYQCIWNPQLGQWQTYPLPQNSPLITSQAPLPNTNLVLPQNPKNMPNYFTPPPLPSNSTINTNIQQISSAPIPSSAQSTINISHNPHINTVGSFAGLSNSSNSVLSTLTSHTQIPAINLPPNNISLPMPKDQTLKEEDASQIRFLGPIPPPVKLPPKWKCAKDKYGRPYYYHVTIRRSQWEPPPPSETSAADEAEFSESESSSDTSTESSGTTTENSDSEDDIDDTKLLMEVRKQIEKTATQSTKSVIPIQTQKEKLSTFTTSPEIKFSGESDMEVDHDHSLTISADDEAQRPSIDIRLKEQFNLKDDKPPKKKRRVGLCEEIIISPRSEEDKLQFREDLKRYKANKEKLRRQKELIIQQTRRQLREVEQQRRAKDKRSRTSLKVKIKDMADFHSEDAKKIKETFRANMASTVVSSLNAYRKSDCKEGRITNTDDFKHLARKLTHFVMLKEMKHISKIDDLLCTDNVKMKAREYIRKYMNKFGEVYVKRNDSPDFKD